MSEEFYIFIGRKYTITPKDRTIYFEGAPLLYTLEPTIMLLLLLLYLRDILNTRKFQFTRFRWSHTEFNGQLKFI